MDKKNLLSLIKNGLIVSCQALPHEPMYSEKGGVMPLFAKAAKEAGAIGIRANTVRDISEIKEIIDLPIIGIIKKDYKGSETYITPTMKEVDDLVKIGCDIIATDFTTQTRENKLTASEFVKEIKNKYPNQLIMADCATFEDAKKASEVGCDFIGTTMNGYTKDSTPPTDGPNLELIKKISNYCKIPIIAEGRISTPEDAKLALEAGAYCVVVGGAITRPLEIASKFVKKIGERNV